MGFSRRDLRRELLDFLGPGRDGQIAARYYGLDGLGGRTLLSVGQEVGLTRERIRQIVTAISQRISTEQPVSLGLDRTIAFVCDRMPASAEEIEAELHSRGLTSGLFRLEGVINAAGLLGKKLPFSITKIHGKRLVHAPCIDSVPLIARIVRRVITHRGMATLSDIVAEVRRLKPGGCNRNLVSTVLTHGKGFSWLDRPAGWFWLSNQPRNPVLNRIRKILSVANPIDISELSKGIARDYRMAGFSPPKRVLLEFCRQAPDLRVYDHTIQAMPRINPNDVLTQAERDIVRIFSEHDGAMALGELKSACLGLGMNCVTFFHTLEYSPILLKDAAGKYGLVGDRGDFCFHAVLHLGETRAGSRPMLRVLDRSSPRKRLSKTRPDSVAS